MGSRLGLPGPPRRRGRGGSASCSEGPLSAHLRPPAGRGEGVPAQGALRQPPEMTCDLGRPHEALALRPVTRGSWSEPGVLGPTPGHGAGAADRQALGTPYSTPGTATPTRTLML